MKKFNKLLAVFIMAFAYSLPLVNTTKVSATTLMNENFTGSFTAADEWISGGGGGSVACLTGGDSGTPSNSIPECSSTAIDSSGDGYLRLTPDTGNSSGFVIYDTPLSSDEGLNIEFQMHQYGGSGADGISFFLIDGAASPTIPGATGGSLGYSRNNSGTPGIIGGYVGVGFDRFGNFSAAMSGSGGPGAIANQIVVRGSEASDYQYVTGAASNTPLSSTTRANSELGVRVTISTTNVMSVAIDYGSGYEIEISGVDLEAINGASSLPANFKFGFAASTGGSTNTHEIRGLSVETNPPNVSVDMVSSGNYVQGSTGSFTVSATNDATAEDTTGSIVVVSTLPVGLIPTSAAGPGWSCDISTQVVTCSRSDVLSPGATTSNISIDVDIASDATTPLDITTTVTAENNANPTPSDTETISVLEGSYLDNDGIFNDEEDAAPNSGDANNDGTPDSQQSEVTSLMNTQTSTYAVMESSGCSGNSSVSISSETANDTTDAEYDYPAGLMDFVMTCAPGATATVNMYFYGLSNDGLVLRKYNPTTQMYTTVAGATFTSVTIGGEQATRISYDITDGGEYDDDGLVNGTIVDPAGPAVLSSSTDDTSESDELVNTGMNALYISTFGVLFAVTSLFTFKTNRQ